MWTEINTRMRERKERIQPNGRPLRIENLNRGGEGINLILHRYYKLIIEFKVLCLCSSAKLRNIIWDGNLEKLPKSLRV